ncbi:GC-rich sequence DNA-binding factor 2 isoform X2 [Lampris incognitus]|uniref:GC-rich sequence DNA-binding factor 2 isoform X2 n=1 Tax=Lampris incognitus TaxID=2546036 RepID=UPI0024B4E689|nr:GC-rich sequence DNA-binding factor 2 isoform X2 [Lampris incognitus]
MFNKKPKRNFRQRKDESSDEEDEHTNGDKDEKNEPHAVSAVCDVIYKPSRLPQGRGISCTSKREATSPKSDSDGEEGTKTELTSVNTELSKSRVRKKDKKNVVLSFSDDKEAEGAEFKLRKSSDKAVVFQARRKEGSSAKNFHNNAPTGKDFSPSASPREDSSSQASPYTSHREDDEDDDVSSLSSSASSPAPSFYAPKTVIIPDAKEIQAARRQRREIRGQKEFIALDRDYQSSPGSSPDHQSRDDEHDDSDVDNDDDEPDDHERRIEFAPRTKGIRERIAEKIGGSDGSVSDSEKEEQELWEETQIGKGVKRCPAEQCPSGSDASSCTDTSNSRRDKLRQKKRSRKLNIPESLPAVTVSMVKRRITAKLDSLKEVHRARQADLRRMEGDVESARTSLENLEEGSSESQLKFYRALTLYVNNLVECLREKVIEINSLELEVHTLLSDQMEVVIERRQKAIREEAVRLQKLSFGTDEQIDNSGKGTQTQGEANKGNEGEEDFCDALEDTQTSAEEEEKLQRQRADILSRSQAVFSDVQEEFCDIKKILSHFEEWRQTYSDSYHSAYISLCLPKLLNPIIRHQLLPWNPLEVLRQDGSGDFEALPWYRAVELFCHGEGFQELEHTDRQTLPNVIEKTLLPKMTAYVELVWDPLCRRQSVCLSDRCHRLREDFSIFKEEQSKPVKVFLEAVVCKLRSCVDEDVFIPLYPKKFLEDKSSPQYRFRDKQFWMAVKLLGNIGKWDLLLSESILKELMLDKLLNRYLMITLLNQTETSDTVHTCKKIAHSLPASWFDGMSVCLPQLQSFSSHLVQTAHSISKQSPEDSNTRSAVVEVLQVLSKIRSFDCILAIAEKYHYQDLIYSHQLLNQEAV